jgi:predicted ribosome-associated RNA-binding protein Tma20
MFFSHKKSYNVLISNKKKSFFSSRNQYFPHIPYVASKKEQKQKIISQAGKLSFLYRIS